MLKKILIFFCVLGAFDVADAYPCHNCKTGKTEEVTNILDCPYVWSYKALARSMMDMRNECELTNAKKFTVIGNWARKNNACFSMNEFMSYCMKQTGEDSLKSVRIGKQNKYCRVLEGKNIVEKIGSIKDEARIGCETLLEKWRFEHEVVRVTGLNLQNAKPGTYVESVKLKSGRNAYRVVDVVLAENYFVNGKINQSVNNSDVNTKIYLLGRNGAHMDTGLRTWTNDMFMDVQTIKGDKAGGVRGVAPLAYIYYQEDLTTELYSYYDKNRGNVGASVANAVASSNGGDLDIKQNIGRRYKVAGQSEGQSHQNGFMVKGKIATADWIGNALFGMNRQEAALPNAVADQFADMESVINNGLNIYDPEPVRHAWDVGSTWVKDAQKNRDKHFKGTQTKTELDAYKMAEGRMLSYYRAVAPVKCVGNCNPRPGTQDVVSCTDKNGKRVEFEFDDICEGRAMRLWIEGSSNPIYHK